MDVGYIFFILILTVTQIVRVFSMLSLLDKSDLKLRLHNKYKDTHGRRLGQPYWYEHGPSSSNPLNIRWVFIIHGFISVRNTMLRNGTSIVKMVNISFYMFL